MKDDVVILDSSWPPVFLLKCKGLTGVSLKYLLQSLKLNFFHSFGHVILWNGTDDICLHPPLDTFQKPRSPQLTDLAQFLLLPNIVLVLVTTNQIFDFAFLFLENGSEVWSIALHSSNGHLDWQIIGTEKHSNSLWHYSYSKEICIRLLELFISYM